ncbi:MAG: thiamine pyrophosphate-dependent enzyme, partial [Solirubrobacteraceae bacterium]
MDEHDRSASDRPLGEPAGTQLLAAMLRARRFEETLLEHADLISGVFHVGIGQEATAAAVALSRAPTDAVMLTHRNHHHLAALGSDPQTMFAEIFGRDGGPQRGRAGTLHLADPGCGVPYTSAMVGGGVPIGLGLALARRRRQEAGISFCVFGDGAMDEGILHEALRLAHRWQLPAVFVCERNDASADDELAPTPAGIAASHGVPAQVVDATEPRRATPAVSDAAAAARGGDGPRFVEMRSAPWPGNSGFLPSRRPPTELDSGLVPPREPWDSGDPILAEVRSLVADGVALAALSELDEEIRARMARAVAAAAAAPLAPAAAALADVWA